MAWTLDDYTPALARDLDFADVIRHLNRGLGRARAISRDIADIQAALDDFTNADLSDIDLARVFLEGLRWSASTRWPAHLTEQICQLSTEIAPGSGIFVIRGGTTNASTLV